MAKKSQVDKWFKKCVSGEKKMVAMVEKESGLKGGWEEQETDPGALEEGTWMFLHAKTGTAAQAWYVYPKKGKAQLKVEVIENWTDPEA